jgi:hypothetical protein
MSIKWFVVPVGAMFFTHKTVFFWKVRNLNKLKVSRKAAKCLNRTQDLLELHYVLSGAALSRRQL